MKQIGISNYNERHLGELLDYAELRPSASQFEIHPCLGGPVRCAVVVCAVG